MLCYRCLFPALKAIVLLVALTGTVQAQDKPLVSQADTLYRVETTDGTVFVGAVTELTKDYVIVQTATAGPVKLSMKYVARIEKVTPEEIEIIEDDVWIRNLQSARYFFAPNGYGLKKGEAYYQNIWILFNQFAVGISEHFSLGFGLMPLFLFNGSPTPVWVTPKFSIPLVKDKINLGAGLLAADVLGDPSGGLGLGYGSLTVGPRHRNFTIGLGVGYVGETIAAAPVINVAGLVRVSRNSYLMTENYLIIDDGYVAGILLFGGRTMIKRTALDYGLVFPATGDGVFVGIPWLGITVPFRRKMRI